MKARADTDEKAVKVLTKKHVNRLNRKSKKDPSKTQKLRLSKRSEKVQRTITVLQRDTYVRPHRHGQLESKGFEFITILKGQLGVLLFYKEGGLVQILRAGTSGPLRGIEIPDGVFHTLVALKPNTQILEVRTGDSIHTEELSTFPESDSPETVDFLNRWHNYFRTPKK